MRQPLKQSLGSKDWLDLFHKVSDVFALMEDGKFDKELFKRILKYAKDLRLRELLQSFSIVTSITQQYKERHGGKTFFLIILDFKDKNVIIKSFAKLKSEDANTEYSILEKKFLGNDNVVLVLVLVDDIKNLRILYPNYFLDTQAFIKILDKVESQIHN